MFGIIKKGLARPALSGFDSPAYFKIKLGGQKDGSRRILQLSPFPV